MNIKIENRFGTRTQRFQFLCLRISLPVDPIKHSDSHTNLPCIAQSKYHQREGIMDATESPQDLVASTNNLRPSSVESSSRWAPDKASEFDFCAVLPIDPASNQLDDKGREIIRRFKALGIETFVYRADMHVFVLLRTPVEILRNFAHSIEFSLQLDPVQLESFSQTGFPDKGIGPCVIPHDEEVTYLRPYDYIYGAYSTTVDEKLYKRPASMGHPFSERHRLKLIRSLIESKKYHKQPIKIRKYILKNFLEAFFPLHNR